jgi:hypothetical protein
MRGFTRMALRLAMVIFLVVGCVENVYYFGELTKNSTYGGYNNYGSGNYYNRSSTYQNTDEIEEIEEVEDEYPDYNRSTSTVMRY